MANVLNRATLQYLQSVNTPDYMDGNWVINPDMSIFDTVPAKYVKLVGDVLVEMTPAERAQVDSNDLEKFRFDYLQVVSSCCEARITNGSGVEFPPGSGFRISTSLNAQIKWMGFANIADMWEAMGYTFPFSVRTLDDTATIELNSPDDVRAAYGTIASFVVATLSAGESVKSAVQAATTIEEVHSAADQYIAESPSSGGAPD